MRLPSALATRLQAAAHIADYARLIELIAEMGPEHVRLAVELRRLAEGFAYDEIEKLVGEQRLDAPLM
jgi:hypothetical protein